MTRRVVRWLSLLAAVSVGLIASDARGFINQADGIVVPLTGRMQACLDRPGTGELSAGAVNAIADAAILPEAFRPVEDPVGSGNYPVNFRMIGEGAGFKNLFGYYWTDEDPTNPANLRMIFDCRLGSICNCPCDPTAMRSSDGSPTSWNRTVNFRSQPGFRPGRAIGFWIRTPELIDGGRNDNHCGGPAAGNQDHRTFFTSQELNDDGDYKHFLIYTSATRDNTYYFGFEDLFRGGDNDYEDVLTRVTGLVPTCTPQPETCDNADNDCDAKIDEGVEMACNTACGSGVRECEAGSFRACTAPSPSAETCDNVDEDCDGSTDEGLSRACMNSCGAGTEICRAGVYGDCSAPTPDIESCNGDDDDCDGLTDENLERPCRSACGSGVEMCVAGTYQGCSAPDPGVESCDNVDNDCDGLTDEGLTQPCMTACGAGSSTCIAGEFVGCSAPNPTLELCNNLDDDCDGNIDEDLTRSCFSVCGAGDETCEMGAWVGCDAPEPAPETCNNIDDDCNGVIDDGNPGGGARCLPNEDGTYEITESTMEGVCVAGSVQCVAGELACAGASSPTREVCNCMDDDCDGAIDEEVGGGGICPGGACLDCACVSPCIPGEFAACPPGRVCDTALGETGFCVAGQCAGVECSDTETCDPLTGECVDLCRDVPCGDGEACVRGVCVENNCRGRGCPADQRCREGSCEPDLCLDVMCPEEQFCREGACVSACTEGCLTNEVCNDGVCEPDPCGGCNSLQSCVNGECVQNACNPPCGPDLVCQGTICISDACFGIECPGSTVCVRGQCVGESRAPAVEPARGLATGGGGCGACAAAGTSSSSPLQGGLAAILLLGLVAVRRRRSSGMRVLSLSEVVPPAALGLAIIAALFLSGCEVDPFCFNGCGDEEPMEDTGPPDVIEEDTGPMRSDADSCTPTGDETCDGEDNDCDGFLDEDFDTSTDARHCGGCGMQCVLPHAFPTCAASSCAVEQCELGWHDLNGVGTDGCEYSCPPSGSELCDGRDNDCDGRTDEDFDLLGDLENCGECGSFCGFANGRGTCSAGVCTLAGCSDGFVDLNSDTADGCEYACTGEGVESCNRLDDDCDGNIDEDFDNSTDVNHCGTCGRVCNFPNANETCVDGVCGVGSCAAGFSDVDGDPSNGCEYACTASGAETCDGVDQDCDGIVDEDSPMVGSACGTGAGMCSQGTTACQLGALTCVGGVQPAGEVCNNVDDDCDGRVDENTAAAPLPGVGDRCGETNAGRCEFGTVACTAGSLTCGGAYVAPGVETCNNIDDDCDGAVDDSPTPPAAPPASCRETRGVCAGRAATCRGAGGWECDPPANFQMVETLCDGLDNDCDGDRDEGCLNPDGSDRRLDLGDGATQNNSVEPVVSGDGANGVFAAWMDRRLGDSRIFSNRSTNGGTSWQGSASRVDDGGGPAIGPQFGSTPPGGDVALVWADFRGSGDREIWSRHSANGLGGFSAANRRTNSGQSRDAFGVSVAAAGDRVYAAYEYFVSARSRQVFLVRSADNGRNWSTPVQISGGSGTNYVAATPEVAAAGNNVYVVWRDNRSGASDVYVNRSTNGGTSFSGERRLDSGGAGSAASFSPDVAAEGDNVYVVWVDDRSGEAFDIYYQRSTNRGGTWLGSDRRLEQDPLPHDSIEPEIVSTGVDGAVVAYIDFQFGFADIVAAETSNAGSTWSVPERLDTGSGAGESNSLELSLHADGDLVAAAWADDRSGLFDVYANYSLDGGQTWQTTDYRMDTSALGTSDSQFPDVYVDGSRVHVVWVDNRRGGSCPDSGGSPTNCSRGDIYYRRMR